MTLTFWLRTTYRFRPSVSPVPRARDCGSPFRFRGALGTSRGRSRSRIDRARERRRTCWHDVPCVQYPVRGHYPLLNKGLNKKQKHKTKTESCVTMPYAAGLPVLLGLPGGDPGFYYHTCRAPFLRMQKPSGMDHAGPTVVIIGRHAKYSWRTASMGLRHMGQLWPMCCRLAAHSRQQHT